MASNENNSFKDVVKNRTVFLWLKELAKSEPQAFVRLTSSNRDRMKRVMGEPDEIQKDGRRVIMIWKISNGGLPIWIVADRMGTCFKVEYPGGESAFINDRKIGSLVVTMLFRLLQSLSRNAVPFDKELSVSG